MGGKQGLPSAPEPEHETGYGQLDRAPVEGRGVNRHSDGETAAQADSELGCFHGAFCFIAASMAVRGELPRFPLILCPGCVTNQSGPPISGPI